MVNSQKVLIVCGPTGVGKTSLALRLAKKFNGELISADSRQVYRGMDIITGKDLPVNPKFEILNPKQITNHKSQITSYGIGFYEIDGIKTWLYDVVCPDYRFNVADYVKCADIVIKDILKRNKLPILVGGTGFYIKALIDGIETMAIKPDWRLRRRLEKLEIEQLREKLREFDPERSRRMNESDRKNPRRLIRAIEIALQIRNSNIEIRNKLQIQNSKLKTKNSLLIGLKAPYKILYQRINARVEERIKQGAEEEIRNLLKKGYQWNNSALGATIGYREWQGFFEKKVTKEEVIQRWKFAEHAYARRQMTWFKKNKKINWFDIGDKKWQDEIEQLVGNWYDAKN